MHDLNIPTLATRCQMSKILLYVISNPFCYLTNIYDHGKVSKNWDDFKHAVNLLVNHNILQRTVNPKEIYFVRKSLEGYQALIHANHLILVDEIYQMTSSKKDTEPGENPRQKTIEKYHTLYALMINVMNQEYRKLNKKNKASAEHVKTSREGQIVILLQKFKELLSGQSETNNDLLFHLESEIQNYKNLRNKISHNAKSVQVAIRTCFKTRLQTKKDAAQSEGIEMKQTLNRMKPYIKPDGSFDFEKMCREGMIESGRGALYLPSEESLLIDLDEIKRAVEHAKGSESKKIRKEAEMFFPEITFQ